MFLRGTAGAIVITTFIAGGIVAASTLRARNSSAASAPSITPDSATAATPTVDSASLVARADHADSSAGSAIAVAAPAAPAGSAPVVESRPVETASSQFAPVVPHGETTLSDGVTAVRGDSDIVVAFDSPMLRTRRPEKFEQFVRSTLAMIYGRPASEALAKLPSGAIASQGDLLSELPTRGVRIPLNGEWMIRVFPETRPGQDGPLVIRYRVRVAPIGG